MMLLMITNVLPAVKTITIFIYVCWC